MNRETSNTTILFFVSALAFMTLGIRFVVIDGELLGLVLAGSGMFLFWLGFVFYRYDQLPNSAKRTEN